MEFLKLVKKNEIEAFQKFLETSDNLEAINAKNQYGWTALHLAAEYGQTDVVQLLLTSSKLTEAFINARDQFGGTALHVAACYGQTEVVQLLLASPKFTEASINAQNQDGSTALHVAVHYGQTEVLKLLLTSAKFVNGNLTKASINAQNLFGWTALHCAAYYGKTEIIAHMLKTEDFELHLHVLRFDLDLLDHQGKKAEDLTDDPKITASFQIYRQAQNQLVYDLTKGA